jgi:hypothetical protein
MHSQALCTCCLFCPWLRRQAAVAGSRSPAFAGNSGQRSDLAIIEVALFFRTELLAAAAAAVAEATAAGSRSSSSGDGASAAAAPSTPTRQQQAAAAAAAAAEAQPVILITNDNAQLQLAKSHGLPAFKLAGLYVMLRGGAAGRGNSHSACADRHYALSRAFRFEAFTTKPFSTKPVTAPFSHCSCQRFSLVITILSHECWQILEAVYACCPRAGALALRPGRGWLAPPLHHPMSN